MYPQASQRVEQNHHGDTSEDPYLLGFRQTYLDNFIHGRFIVIAHTHKDSADYDHLKALALFSLREKESKLDFRIFGQ